MGLTPLDSILISSSMKKSANYPEYESKVFEGDSK